MIDQGRKASQMKYLVSSHPIANVGKVTLPAIAADLVLINLKPAQALLSTVDADVLKALLWISGYFRNENVGNNELVVGVAGENTWQAKMDAGIYLDCVPDGQYTNGDFEVAAQNDVLPFNHTFDVTTQFQTNVDGDLSLQLFQGLSLRGSYDLVLLSAVALITWRSI